MRKAILLILLFIAFSIPVNADDTLSLFAKMNPYIIGEQGVAVGGAESCTSCSTETYMFCYNGDFTADTDKACFTNGDASKDAAVNTVDYIGTDYSSSNAVDETLQWPIAGEDGASDSEGTLFCSTRYVDGGSGIRDAIIFEIWNDFSNHMYCRYRDTSDQLYCQFTSQAGGSDTIAGGTLSVDTNYRLGYTWQTGADAGGKHSWSMQALGSDPSWTEEVVDLDDWDGADQPDKIAIHEDQQGSHDGDTIRIWDCLVLTGYQTDDPRQ